MIVSFRHLINKKNCLLHAKWDGAVLYCCICQRPIALRYQCGKEIRVYAYNKYKKYKQYIQARPDTAEITDERDLLGKIDFSKWGDFLHDVQSGENSILSLQVDNGWVPEISEGYESGQIRGNYISCGEAAGREEDQEDAENLMG